MNALLEVDGVTKHYEGFTLDNVSFSLPAGSIMGLIGENGAGKTTTIKAILNLISSEGSVMICGLDHIKNEKEVKNKVGAVLDDCNFYPALKPENISKILGSIHPQWDDDLFRKYLKDFRVPENKIIKEMSRGTQVKLNIAAALSHKPNLLILDESTSGLDPVSRDEILDIFLDFVQDENHSILVSSHITSDLEKVADYITYIHNGKVVLSDSKDDILYNYGILKCKNDQSAMVDKEDIIVRMNKDYGVSILVKNKEKIRKKYKDMVVDDANLEDIMLFYVRGEIL